MLIFNEPNHTSQCLLSHAVCVNAVAHSTVIVAAVAAVPACIVLKSYKFRSSNFWSTNNHCTRCTSSMMCSTRVEGEEGCVSQIVERLQVTFEVRYITRRERTPTQSKRQNKNTLQWFLQAGTNANG